MQKKLEYANLQLFGDRRWKLKPKMTDGGLEKVDSDWKKEKDDYDGIDDAFCTDSVNNQSQEVKEPSKKERDLSDCLDEHKTMGVVGFNKGSDSGKNICFLGWWRTIDR